MFGRRIVRSVIEWKREHTGGPMNDNAGLFRERIDILTAAGKGIRLRYSTRRYAVRPEIQIVLPMDCTQ